MFGAREFPTKLRRRIPPALTLSEDHAGQAFAGKALSRRLRAVSGVPAWASYAPLEVKLMMGWPVSTPTGSSGGDASSDSGSRYAGDAEAVLGQVWRLARTGEGTRAVQDAFETAHSDELRAGLASELHGHAWEAAMCPHANYSLQKCIMAMPPRQVEFVIEELCDNEGGIVQVAQHKYGCRIVQRLLEHCLPSQLARPINDLLENAVIVAKHPFGNYVLQKILEVAEDKQRSRLIAVISENIPDLASDVYAWPVLSKAVVAASADERALLAKALGDQPELLGAMSRMRQGRIAVKCVFEALDDVQWARISACLSASERQGAKAASMPPRTFADSFCTADLRTIAPCVH